MFSIHVCFPDVKNLSGALPSDPPPRLHYESVAELTAPCDVCLHFATFKNSILFQKMDMLGIYIYIYIYIYIFAVLTFLRPFCVYTL